jgi:predicted AAA+ superfamily ATPase
MIIRLLENNIRSKLNIGKAIVIIGARQTGKTSLLKKMFVSEDVLWLDADEPDVREIFNNATSSSLRVLFSNYKTIIVDEAQRIDDVGLTFKLITDHLKDKQLIATGSSSFDLTNKLNELLTGRKWEYMLFPISFAEMVKHHGLLEEKRLLHHRLLYGYYPDVVNNPGNEKEILKQLTDSYLYKDILMWQNIKKPDKLVKLLQALAFQVCNEVSYNELGKTIGLDNETVEKYIQLLEKSFVIFRLRSFSRNLRKELKKSSKIYFYDNGIRNSLIANFSPVTLRQDIGALWENYFVAERIKHNHYNNIWTNNYFWRTHDQQEIDFIEDSDGKLSVYEIKWNENRKPFLSKTFDRAYPNNEYHVVNRDNFDKFIM